MAEMSLEQQQALAMARARRRRAEAGAGIQEIDPATSPRFPGIPVEQSGEGSKGPWTKYQQEALDELNSRRAANGEGPWSKYQPRDLLARQPRDLLAGNSQSDKSKRQFTITAPNGKKYRVTGSDPEGAVGALRKHLGETETQPAKRTEPLHPEFDPANVPHRNADPSRVTAALSSAVEGIPIAGPYLQSGVENVAAGIGSLIEDRPRSEVRAEMGKMVDDAQEAYPITSTASGVGGAVAGTLPMVMAAPAMFGASGGGLLMRTIASGLSGTAIGGADSAVRSGGDPREVLRGAISGGGMGLAGPLAGKVVGSSWQRLRDFRAARGAAKASGMDRKVISTVGRAVRDDGLDPATIGQRMNELGPDAMMMDLGPNLQRQGGALAATPGRGQEIVRSSIANRQANAGNRISGVLDDALGQPADTLALADDIVTKRASAAKPLYQKAYQEGSEGVWSPELERMAGSPMFSEAMRRAATTGKDRAILDGFGSFNPRVTVTQDGRISFNQSRAGGSPLYPDLQYWDYVKRNLDDIAGEAKRAGRSEQASIATNLATNLRGELDKAVPSYRAARDAYAGPSAIMEAMEEGQGVFRNSFTPGQLRQRMSSMSEAEREAFVQGARAQIADAMGTARNDALSARSMFQKGYNRDKLEMLIGKPQAEKMLQALDAEATFARTSDVVTGNSETMARSQAMKEIAGESGPQFGLREGYMSGGMLGGLRSAGVRTGEKLIDALASASREARNAGLADAISSSDFQKIVNALMKSQARKVPNESIDRIARALMIGGGTAATRP